MLREHEHATRQGRFGEDAAQPLAHLAGREVPGRVEQGDRGADALAPLGVGQPEHDDVEHVVEVAGHRVLDDAGVDLEAAAVDDVVGAAVDDEQAVVVEVAEVVGAEPPHAVGVDGERVGGQAGLAEVAVGDGVAAEHDVAVVVDVEAADGQRRAVVDAAPGRLAHPVGQAEGSPRPSGRARPVAVGVAAPPTSTPS